MRSNYTTRTFYQELKLKKAKPEDRRRRRILIARANRHFYKNKTKELLKGSTWTLLRVQEWLNTARPELDGMTPKEGLACLNTYKSYSIRVFKLLATDLGLDLKTITKKVPKIEVTYGD